MPTRPPIHQPHGGSVEPSQAHDRWRGSAASRGYDGPWRALRKAKLQADPLCWWCQRDGCLTAATTVDHIEPISVSPGLRLVWSNLRSGCKPCHDAHTARQVADGHRGTEGAAGIAAAFTIRPLTKPSHGFNPASWTRISSGPVMPRSRCQAHPRPGIPGCGRRSNRRDPPRFRS